MPITPDKVLHVASLARLQLSETEVERFTRDLDHILNHVDELTAVSTDGVPPTDYVAVSASPLRLDEPKRQLSQAEALRPAPQVLEQGFGVPAFVDD